jgi:hypothetical protein
MCFLAAFPVFATAVCEYCEPVTKRFDSICNACSDSMSNCELQWNQCQRRYCVSDKDRQREALDRQKRLTEVREAKAHQSITEKAKANFSKLISTMPPAPEVIS